MITIKVKFMDMYELVTKALDNVSMYRGRSEVYVNTDTRNYMETVQELYHMEYVDTDDSQLHVDILLYEDICKIANIATIYNRK